MKMRTKILGFSLIEVLVSIVILSTGMLSIAALQGKLAINSADARARSRIAVLISGVLDMQREKGYDALADIGATGCVTTSPTEIESAICDAQTDAGVSGIQYSQIVVRLYGLSSGGAFTTTAPASGTDYVEYKQVTSTASWKDATGKARSLSMKTMISALNLGSAATTLLNKALAATSITPVVHQADPGLSEGVIPIAVGTNATGGETNAASTNPRPTVGVTMPSTTFSTLTYTKGASDTSLTATIQKRVETTVAECACQFTSTNPYASDVSMGTYKYRPTYWDGQRYIQPESSPVASPYSQELADLKGAQSNLCPIVCRDHHDSSSDSIKYDAVTGDLDKYKLSVATTGNGNNRTTTVALAKSDDKPVPAGTTDAYVDAARLIRVDGLWKVATDMRLEHMGLLVTRADDTSSYGSSTSPSTAAEAAYGGSTGFVVDYIGQRLRQIIDSGSAPDGDAMFETHGLDVPAQISIGTTSNAYKYLNARGLYLDWLEEPALDKLKNIGTDCGDFPTCMLPYLPFNTINVTQLANWSRRSASAATRGKIDVKNSTTSNDASICDTSNNRNQVLIRGCVSGVSGDDSSGADYDAAVATLGPSNSAVAASMPISPYELDSANDRQDAQEFSVTGTATSSEFFARVSGGGYTRPDATSGVFWTEDLSTTNEPTVAWETGTASDFCAGNISRTDADPNPYDCVTTVPVTVPLTVTLSNYNQVVTQDYTYTVPVTGAQGKVNRPVLICYQVISANVANYPSAGPSSVDNSYAVAHVASSPGSVDDVTTLTISGPSPIASASREVDIRMEQSGSAAGAILSTDVATGVPTFSTPTSCN